MGKVPGGGTAQQDDGELGGMGLVWETAEAVQEADASEPGAGTTVVDTLTGCITSHSATPQSPFQCLCVNF
jgi:hypothetical protein